MLKCHSKPPEELNTPLSSPLGDSGHSLIGEYILAQSPTQILGGPAGRDLGREFVVCTSIRRGDGDV